MLLTGKQPAEQLYSKIDERVRSMTEVPGLFALYDPEDKPAGWYLRSIQRAGEAHGIPVYARPLSEGTALPMKLLGGMIVLSKTNPEKVNETIAFWRWLIDLGEKVSFVDGRLPNCVRCTLTNRLSPSRVMSSRATE